MSFTSLECRACRADFPALARAQGEQPLAYLDGPGGTQVPQRVIDTIHRAYSHHNANRHGLFVTSIEVDDTMLRARQIIADFLGAENYRCISLGANMTTLSYSLSHALARALVPGDEIVVTQLDHEANRAPWTRLRAQGFAVHEIRLKPDGRLDETDMRSKIGARTKIVALGYSSNVLGTVNAVEVARGLTAAVDAYLVVDAVHYAPHFPINLKDLGADFVLCSGYKFYGPHVGILYTRPGLLETLITDVLPVQEQAPPYLIETGTLNHPAIEGVAAAIEYIASWGAGQTLRSKIVDAMDNIRAYEHALGRYYYEEVQRIAGVRAWGTDFSTDCRAPTVSITLDGITAATLAQKLGALGLCLWAGHFYAPRPIETLGLDPQEGLLRMGISMYNDESEIERLLGALRDIAAERSTSQSG
jgi:cysteine desulfurase family protein (TIGR01976 family)